MPIIQQSAFAIYVHPHRYRNAEFRSGLITQAVKADLERHSIPTTPTIGKQIARVHPGKSNNQPETLMSLSFNRLTPLLLGVVKELTGRVRDLESRQQYMKWRHALQDDYGYIQGSLHMCATGRHI